MGSTDRPPRDLYWPVHEAILRRFAELEARTEIAPGAISSIESRVGEALKLAVDEAWQRVKQSTVKHTDGTTWYQGGEVRADQLLDPVVQVFGGLRHAPPSHAPTTRSSPRLNGSIWSIPGTTLTNGTGALRSF